MTSTYMDMYTSMHATLAIQHGRGPACTSWRCVAPSVPSSEHCYIVIVTRVQGRGAMRPTHHTGRSPCTVQSPSCAKAQRLKPGLSQLRTTAHHRHTVQVETIHKTSPHPGRQLSCQQQISIRSWQDSCLPKQPNTWIMATLLTVKHCAGGAPTDTPV
jgi:hypothetical protein